MGIKTYLALSSLINLTLFFLLSLLADQQIEGPYPKAFLILCPLVIAMFQFSAVRPRAKELPEDMRTSYWAYREANKPTWMLAAIVGLSGLGLLFGLVGAK